MKKILGERYELGAMIGTGGMADVYLAQDVRLNRQVAIKILRSDLARAILQKAFKAGSRLS